MTARDGFFPVPVLILLLAACSGDGATEPEAGSFLSGQYDIHEWYHVSGADTFRLTDDSYLHLRFDGDRVEGEGRMAMVRWIVADGVPQRHEHPVFGKLDEEGTHVPLEVRGWHYVVDREGESRLRFLFRKSEGAGTWLEEYEWTLEPDRRSYFIELHSDVQSLRIVHRRR